MCLVAMTQQTTREDEFTLEEAQLMITGVEGVEEGSNSDVWATFQCDNGRVQDALDVALDARGVVVHKVERQDGFLSVALEDYADEL